VREPGIRAFLLQNLLFGRDPPAWRIGLDEIAAAMPEIEDFPASPGATYRGPTLFVTGERSDYVREEHRAQIATLFPDHRFVTVPNAGHWVHAEAPQAFVETLRTFLS